MWMFDHRPVYWVSSVTSSVYLHIWFVTHTDVNWRHFPELAKYILIKCHMRDYPESITQNILVTFSVVLCYHFTHYSIEKQNRHSRPFFPLFIRRFVVKIWHFHWVKMLKIRYKSFFIWFSILYPPLQLKMATFMTMGTYRNLTMAASKLRNIQ